MKKKWSILIGVAIAIILSLIIVLGTYIAKTNGNIRTIAKKQGNIDNVKESNAIVSSAAIISAKTGTGPFDANDNPGNDSTENNNIVRSFDQVTWTVDLTMNSKNNKSIAGSKIQVEATLPEATANVMEWDLNSMQWIENGQVSGDGRQLTGSYTLSDTETSSSAKQTLIFVLNVYGAGNGTEIIPTFNFKIDGNEDTEKVEIKGEKVTVSAVGKYNIKFIRNGNLSKRVLGLNYDGQSVDGRVYGYAFVLQLYNDNPSKGLKGIEYPQGDINFDIDLKLQRSQLGTSELEDITNISEPLLWNYKVNFGNEVIPNRSMAFGDSNQNARWYAPRGINSDRNCGVYNSGNITMQQEGGKIKVNVKNYAFDGIFPKYNNEYTSNSSIVFTDNIGCFSVGYFQLIVPDNEETTVDNRNYYLTVSDSNLNAQSITGIDVKDQMIQTDDSNTLTHYRFSSGSFDHHIYLYNNNGMLHSIFNTGDAVRSIGQEFYVRSYVDISPNNDPDDQIKSVDRFLKFDGDAFEVIDYNNNMKFYPVGMDNMEWDYWYVTKKDGTNWTNQTEMNNGRIEDMILYKNKEDIPEGFTCIGVYIESKEGHIEVTSSVGRQYFNIRLKVKESAKINTTYGITQTSKYWRNELDRNIYSQEKLDSYDTYPTTTWNSGYRQYIKTEYDENGSIVPGTHSGSYRYGQTVLIIGANLHGEIKAIDNSNKEKVNYDLGKNEGTVTYKIEPKLENNTSVSSEINNVTLKAEVTIPNGLEYVTGSTKRGDTNYTEPNITRNSDGSTKLQWYIYNCTVGQTITPITFNAQIYNETANGTQYETKFVISEVIGKDGVSQVGNSEIGDRTSTVSINIINLASHRLYKETETPVIEKNGDIKYKITYENKTEAIVTDFQLLDILPYVSDNRESNFNGTYTLKSVNITQTIEGQNQEIDNLKIYTTNSDEVRGIDAKNEEIGISNIWDNISVGEVNKESKGVAVKGEVAGKTKVEIEIILKTNGNKAKDIYSNTAMAQVYSNSEQMETSKVNTYVVNRYIEGKVWQDNNANGVIDEGEKYLSGVTLKLINIANNTEIATTVTNENGEYRFNDLNRGRYKIKVEVNGTYYDLTEKEVGTNVETNSKFNEESKETDEIGRLDGIESPELAETNVNAGLKIKTINITITKKWNDNENIAGKRPNAIDVLIKNGEQEVERQELNGTNNWTIISKDLPKYDENLNEIKYTVEEQEKKSDDFKFYKTEIAGNIETGYIITNTFEVPEEKVNVPVTKIWEDTEEQKSKRPQNIKFILTAESITPEQIPEKYKRMEQTITIENQNEENTHEWKYIFNNLPKYDNYGNEITYKATEEMESIFYKQTAITGEMQTGYKITNTFVRPETKIEITVTKKWVDEENIYGKRPEEIKIQVKDETGKVIKEQTAKKGENWQTTITELDKYDENGQEIQYKVDEEEIEENSLFNYDKQLGEVKDIEGKTDQKEATITNIMAKVPAFVHIKYVDINTKEEIAQSKTQEGLVGENYDIAEHKKEIPDYTLVKEPDPTTGTYTKEDQEKIYYYAKNTQVIVRYLEKDNTPEDNTDNKVLTEQDYYTISGYEGKDYETEKKEIENFTYVEDTGNTKGKMTEAQIEVIYYYAQNTKAIVQHIDRETGEILKQETQNGKVGDLFETHPENFEEYVLVESPKEPNIIMDKTGEQTVKYYYAHISEGLIEKHIDEITGELLYSEQYEGNEGDPYYIPSREFEGYDLVEVDKEGNSKLPENARGEYTKELTEVTYYYIKRANVRTEYIDKLTGEKLTEDEIINGHEKDEYKTEEKSFEGYDLVEIPKNAEGIMEVTENGDGSFNSETVVQYYYIKIAGGVKEKHIDIITEKELHTGEHKGHVKDPYSILAKKFDGYDLVEKDEEGNSMLPTNAEGEMTEEPIEVVYYYIKKATVRVEYIDELTGEKLTEDIIIEGHEKDPYKTEKIEFDGYDLVKEPENKEGTMEITENEDGSFNTETVVQYYYKQKAEVEVRFIEKESGKNYEETEETNQEQSKEKELAERETIKGYVKDLYQTKPKDIQYYRLVDQTTNTEGEMTEEKIIVKYYYEKQKVDLSIDKWISNVNIAGQEKTAQTMENRDELYKIEISRKRIQTEEVKVTYKIRITNKGEIEGKATKITERIPEGYSFKQEDNNIHWTEENGVLTTEDLKGEAIKPGEYKEIEIVLRWNKGEVNFGQKTNIVEITKQENPAGFEDIDKNNNISKTEMIMSVSTGIENIEKVAIVIIMIQVLMIIGIVNVLIKLKANK